VFAGLLQSAAGPAGEMTRAHYQAAFLPLVYGVGLAVVLTFFLRETGRAAAPPVQLAQREIA